ncbi:hypothetical protein DL764_010500 [Monosporascus ibericus]|uniref:Fungal N-terminal domain-containing protein n=1 Tax=Monosporascus ibericus TaxID=155417 RepID=A0A4Q4SSP9_9PEZI|nr:hypothetical protein DL764_010500 [Monosporascus ibericus]
MEFVASLSAIMGIADILIKLTKELHSSINTARAAPEEVKRFARETSTFTDLLDYFSEVVKRLPKSKDAEAKYKKNKLFRNVKNECEILRKGIEELLEKFTQMKDGGLRTLWARLLWTYKRSDVEFLRRCLESSKSTVSLLATLFCLEKENAEGGGGAGVGKVEIMYALCPSQQKAATHLYSVKLETQLQNKLLELQEANQELEEYERHHNITLQVAQGVRYSRMIRSTYDLEEYAARQISSQREATTRGLGDGGFRERRIRTRPAPLRDFPTANQNLYNDYRESFRDPFELDDRRHYRHERTHFQETDDGYRAARIIEGDPFRDIAEGRRRVVSPPPRLPRNTVFSKASREEVEQKSDADGHTLDRPPASTGLAHDADGESAGPYRPMPPFGGSGDRKRPRRPRPRSSMG